MRNESESKSNLLIFVPTALRGGGGGGIPTVIQHPKYPFNTTFVRKSGD